MTRLTLMALLTLSTFSHAGDFDTFIGVEGGSTDLTFNQIDSQRGGEFGLRIGFVRDTGRVFLSANSASLDRADLNSLALNFDAITPRAYHFNDSFGVRGFLGVHGGVVQLKPDVIKDDEGGMGGGKAGVFLDFPANISLEIGYKVTWANIDLGTQAVKNYQTIYAAYNYTF